MHLSTYQQLFLHKALTLFIASVWLINGLYCKLLNGVFRHEKIVARILGESYASLLTKTIGFSECLLFLWIISRIKPRFCAIFQIIMTGLMNGIEFFLAPDLLLFGHLNSLFALMFISIIYSNEFLLVKNRS